MSPKDTSARAFDGGAVATRLNVEDSGVIRYKTEWVCEQWDEDKVEFAKSHLKAIGRAFVPHNVSGQTILRPFADGVPSDLLRHIVGVSDRILVVEGNLLVNEGLQRLRDLLVAAGGTAYNNANAFIGVGDTNTAEAASQTELQATANAANRFYKGMNATFPTTSGQAATWAADFTSGEANFLWAEWTVAAGATSASGSGFLVGTTNLNRKVQSLGTKATGTWTLSATITFS
jgi:hypothetical protein